jgi:ABC-type spermidine/putrescine transport system permease subunit II
LTLSAVLENVLDLQFRTRQEASRHALFVAFILAPVAIVCIVAFTPEGNLSLTTKGLSLRWFIASHSTITLPVRMFLYVQDNVDPLVTSVSAALIFLTIVAMVILDRLFGLDRLFIGAGR